MLLTVTDLALLHHPDDGRAELAVSRDAELGEHVAVAVVTLYMTHAHTAVLTDSKSGC